MQNNEFNNIITQIRNGQNPQQIVLSMLEGRLQSTPIGSNLLQLAKENKTADIEKIARNMVAARGGDFDREFTAFKKQWGFE